MSYLLPLICYILALKYWLEKKIEDFDEDLLNEIYSFVNGKLKEDGHIDMANALHNLLDSKVLPFFPFLSFPFRSYLYIYKNGCLFLQDISFQSFIFPFRLRKEKRKQG